MNFKSVALSNLSPGSEWSVLPDGTIEWHNVVGTQPTDDEIQTEVDRLIADAPWADLRALRTRKLAETDWWAMSDLTMTAEQTAYRQALRDLPDNTTDPANVVWPTKPN
jgi:hypothetical protein